MTPPPSRRYYPLLELIKTRVREFFREPEAIFWVYGFPLILAVGLGVAFRSQPAPEFRVAIDGVEVSARASLEEDLAKVGVTAVFVKPDRARDDLARGRVDLLALVVAPSEESPRRVRYIYDPARTDSLVARARVDDVLQHRAGRRDPLPTVDRRVQEPGSRYIDFFLPGLIGMNLMGGGLFGVGFVIVDMRVRKLLKRFLATPMERAHFFLAVLLSRMVFLIPEMLFLLLIAVFGFDLPIRGSLLDLVLVILLSSLSFSGLGLLVATRARKIETISGLMNLVMLPMWLLSGIFFSTDRFPDTIQPFVQALPLTATNDLLRAVILEGAPIWSEGGEIAILVGWGGLSFLLSLKLFRWI